MIVQNIDKNIILFKNFITQEESESLLTLASGAGTEEWAKYNYTERDEHNEWEDRILILNECSNFDKNKRLLVDDIFYRIKTEVGNFLKKDIYEYTGFDSIYRSIVGQEMKTHSDRGLGVKFKYGLVLYLNDDYEGGEIFYPNAGIELKPQACSLVMHPAHEGYRHGVKKVSAGTRYSMTSFLRLK